MKRILPFVFLTMLAITGAPKHANAGQMTAGDTTFAAAGSFKIYPFFIVNGGHIHAPQWVGDEGNNFQHAARGWIYSRYADLRINVYSGVIEATCTRDTSGFTIPAGGSYTALPDCDSIRVVVTGPTTVSWNLFK